MLHFRGNIEPSLWQEGRNLLLWFSSGGQRLPFRGYSDDKTWKKYFDIFIENAESTRLLVDELPEAMIFS